MPPTPGRMLQLITLAALVTSPLSAEQTVAAENAACDSEEESTLVQIAKHGAALWPAPGPPAPGPKPLNLKPQPVSPLFQAMAKYQPPGTFPQVRTYYFPANGADAVNETINIGLYVPLPNGPSSVGLGLSLEQAYTDAVARYMQRAGGISIAKSKEKYGVAFYVVGVPTIGTYENYDIQYAATVDAIKYMLSDEFPVFIHYIFAGPTTRYSFRPLVDVMVNQTEPSKQKVVITGASGVTTTIGRYDRAFSFLGPGTQYMISGVQLMVQRGAKKFFIASDYDVFPEVACRGVREYQEASNTFTITNTENHLIRAETAAGAVQAASSSGADVFVLCTEHIDICANFLSSARSANYNPNGILLLFCGGNAQFELTQEENLNAAFVTVASPWFSVQPGRGEPGSFSGTENSSEWNANFATTYMYNAPYMGPAAWTGMTLLLSVIEDVGLDYEPVTEAIYRTDQRNFYANIAFNLTNPNTGSGRVGQAAIYGSAGQYDGDLMLRFVSSVDPVIAAGASPADFCYPKPPWGSQSCAGN